MGSDIAKLVADLKSNPQAMAQPNAATVTYVACQRVVDLVANKKTIKSRSDALKVASDITTLVSDIAKLAADSKAK